MSDTPTTSQTTPARQAAPSGPGVVATGWLAANSTFEHADERRLGPAFVSSLVAHVVIFLVAVLALSYTPEREVMPPPPPPEYDVVFLEQLGPGGGGGGSPEPAPPTPIEVPETKPPEPVPVEVVPEVPPPPRPIPTLVAPIQTNASNVIQASGTTSVAIGEYGDGGRGGGLGPGTGAGVGPGADSGFGGGPAYPGNGILPPGLLVEVKPTYTSEGMRAKVQGEVTVEAVVLENGSVGEVQIFKSLDRQYGLDQAALDAARQWKFTPCKRQGTAVQCKIQIILDFRIH